MPRTIVVVDADACIPTELAAAAEMRVAPPDARLLLQPDSVAALRADAGPPPEGPVGDACAQAAEDAGAVLYVGVGDGYGSPQGAAEYARHAVQAHVPGAAFEVYDSGAALMGAGWQALAAARVLRDGGTVEAARLAAEVVAGRVQVLAMLEHPELAIAAGATELGDDRQRALVMLEGPGITVLGRLAKRDQALQALRNEFARRAAEAEGALHVAVHHAGAQAGAEALATWTERTLHPSTLVVAPLTRHAATRLGPRMLGVAWYRE
ncbi:MAG TPA: hypothetical protein VFH77_14680 [Streptomyces sp.]|nr:hypothetical protein [Streptomyces sp.]